MIGTLRDKLNPKHQSCIRIQIRKCNVTALEIMSAYLIYYISKDILVKKFLPCLSCSKNITIAQKIHIKMLRTSPNTIGIKIKMLRISPNTIGIKIKMLRISPNTISIKIKMLRISPNTIGIKIKMLRISPNTIGIKIKMLRISPVVPNVN